MKKQRMTADNVEQLMEIVRALQTGEDPAEALERKKAESVPLADSPKSNPEEDASEKKRQRRPLFGKREEVQSGEIPEEELQAAKNGQARAAKGKSAETESAKKMQNERVQAESTPTAKVKNADVKNAADTDEDEFFEDEFEENLQDDNHRKFEKPDVNAVLDQVSEALWNLVRTIDLVIEPLTSWRPKTDSRPKTEKKTEKKTGRRKTEKEQQKETIQEDAVLMEEYLTEELQKEDAVSEEVQTGASQAAASSEETQLENAQAGAAANTQSEETVAEKIQAENAQSEEAVAEEAPSETAQSEETGTESAQTDTVQQEEPPEKTEDQKTLDRILDRADTSAKQQGTESEDVPEQTEKKPEGKRSGSLMAKLGEKGIHRKEIIMILLVVILAAAIVVLITHGVRNSMEQKRKSEHVTADKGLTVTVEQEPEQWTSSAEIQLRFRTPRVPVTSVTINGMVLQPDADGYVTFTTSDYLLEAEAETENGTLKAVIEIPKLDSQAPVVNASKAQNQITLMGADSRSSIKAVWYAVVRDTDPIQLPLYQEYTGTISFEEGVLYYFYAVDAAGNKSVPIVTNMETATSIALAKDELAMSPGETVYLELQETPAGALLNNLRYESMNPDVLEVDGSGAVTALKEGTGAVKVSADGVDSVNCIITVSRTRTVTISAIGDCTLGTDQSFNTTTNLNAYAAMNGYSYFFENVRAILENDDVTFANLEGTLTTSTSRASKTYAFKGEPEYTEILKEGSVEVVTLANNHSEDYGTESYEDTVKYLKEAGIAYCDGDQIAIQEVNGVKTAFIGIYVLRDGIAKEEQVRTTIAAAKEAGAQLVIMAFHWGSEKSTQADSTQVSLAHTAIDNGADLVVGHHPHVLQGIEKYNGKYIVYSLANFCFGGNTAPSDKDTMIFRQTFTLTDGEVQDDDQIEIIPCSVSSVSDYNNYQPTPATGEEADRIMSRVNEYSQEYGQTYVASDGLS